MRHETDILTDERQLVIRLIDGDEDAFCKLYAAYKDRLIYFATSFLKSTDLAEDIFQDTFIAIWQGRHFINSTESFSSYLYTIVRNRIFNQLRDLNKESLLKKTILSHAIDYTNNTQEKILANNLQEIICQAIEELSPRQREIFKMSREGHMTYKEIADTLNISVNTVREHLSVSLHNIRTFLSKYSADMTSLFLIKILLHL